MDAVCGVALFIRGLELKTVELMILDIPISLYSLRLRFQSSTRTAATPLFPSLQLLAQPAGIAVFVAHQARIRAILRAESRGHFRIGDVVDLVISRLEHQRVHDTRHMAGNATAGLGGRRMVRMRFGPRLVLRVALDAHAVRIAAELERFGIR